RPLDSLALVGERERGAARRESPRDRPRDRPLVRNTEDQRRLPGELRHRPILRARLRELRRIAALLAVAAALAMAASAAAGLRPINRTYGDLVVPRVRAGTIEIPAGHATNRLRVIVTLHLPPLAAAYPRTLSAASARQRLDVESTTSRAYLA